MTDHSDHYYDLVDMVQNPDINFVGIPPTDDERPEAIKEILHSVVNHQYMDHELTESEADDLHQYIEERRYV